MRTVTFSDRRVADAVNSTFVPVWFNRGRGFHNCERRTEKRIFEQHGEAYPTKNICTFFLTPDLRVVSYVSGYLAPELFLDVLASAETLKGAEGDEFMRRHRGIANDLAGRLERTKEKPVFSLKYRDLEHGHAATCVEAMRDAFQHRREVHDALAASGPAPFERVQHGYLYGNSFSEEKHVETVGAGEFPRPKVPTGPSR